MHQSGEDLALERLEALVGGWTMEAGPAGGAPWPGEAAVTFEWLRGRAFLIERWVVPAAFDGIAIIGAGEEPDRFRRHYFDGRWRAAHLRNDIARRRLEAVARRT